MNLYGLRLDDRKPLEPLTIVPMLCESMGTVIIGEQGAMVALMVTALYVPCFGNS